MATDPRVQAVIMALGIWGGVTVPLLFAVYYTCIARWWESPLGRTLIALDLCVMLLRAERLAGFWFHGAAALGPADWVVSIAMLAIPVIIGYRMISFERKRRRMKREARKTAEVVNLILTGLVP